MKMMKFATKFMILTMVAILIGNGLLSAQQTDRKNHDSSGLLSILSAVQNPKNTVNTYSFEFDGTPLNEALREIANSGRWKILTNSTLIPENYTVTTELRHVNLFEAFDRVLEHTDLDYLYSGKGYVIIVRKEEPVFQQEVTGRVVDAQTGESLPGVNVVVLGSEEAIGSIIGTQTDIDGIYSMDVPENLNTLAFSYIGYQTEEVTINGRAEINVELQPGIISGEELVVIGYGEQRRENLTGSVSQVDSEDIEVRSSNTATQALQGLAPNLNIDVTSNGGAADASMNINIRGVGSLSSSDPYILIDGVRATQDDLDALNVKDIDNISVLKDAASAAIYGAQAAYGVILIETKKGDGNQDLTFEYSNNLIFKKRIFVPPSVNSLEYAEVLNEASQNYSGQVAVDEEQMELIRRFVEGELQYGTAPDPNNPNQWLGIQSGTSNGWYSGFANTDWWDVMYNDVGVAQQHNISASGGSENISYRISGAYFNDAGQLAYGSENENYDRYNLSGHINADITDWLRVSNNTSYWQENNIFPATLEGGSRGRLYHDIMRFSPLAPYKTPPVEDEQGNIIVPEQLALIPGFSEKNGFNAYNINNLTSTLKAEIELTPSLVVEGDFTFKRNFYDRTLNFKRWSLLGPTGTPSLTYQTNNNQIRKDIRKENYLSFNIYSNYSKSFLNRHNVGVLVGYQQEENNFFGLDVTRQGVIADDINSLNTATGNIIGPNNPMSTWATLGVFGRFTYNFDEKYLFEFNGRYDGTSRFAEGNRFGFYPSVSAGYNIHRENFWDPLSDIINTIKIRASWGKLGNQEVASYLHLSSIPISNRLEWVMNGERPIYSEVPDIVSPDITWETATVKNIGADLSFLNHRLSTTIDVYERITDNMFGPSGALPSVLGTDPPETNSASLKTTGWELTVGWQDQRSDFGYNMKFMLSDNKTVITEYHNPEQVISSNSYYVGQELGEIWGFEADELFQSQAEVDEYLSQADLTYFGTGWQPGNVKYEDLNGDGIVNIGENTVNNPGDRKIIGNSTPRYRISFQAGAAWRNFDFNMLWQGIGKRDFWIDSYATLLWGWNSRGHTRITEATLDYWSEENSDGYLPIQLESGGSSGFAKDRHPSTRYLQDASYIRLKSLSIGYTLPPSLVEKLNIRSMRIYVNGENLLTFTNMWENFDPELVTTGTRSRTSVGRAYPLAQTYGIGVDITF